ncbi:MAG: hypothetical protein R3212_01075 [Xanthomonadales bacterium]|nr:hypothetical protein [Xanthomonadales bacterium]
MIKGVCFERTTLRRRQLGLTLIELMVAALLAIFLVGGILLLHLSGRATFIDAEQLSRIQENVRFASDYMIRDIRNAGFRDEAVLRAGHEQQIRQAYAQILNDGSTLRIRYAGRGHCTEAFDEFRLVENEYSLDANTGELVCRGRTVPRDDPGSTLVTDQDFSDPVGLVGGLTGIAFQLICPDGGTACACDVDTDLDSACIGVNVAMQFEGMRALDTSGDFENRSIELTAAFRNVVLDRANAYAFAEEE